MTYKEAKEEAYKIYEVQKRHAEFNNEKISIKRFMQQKCWEVTIIKEDQYASGIELNYRIGEDLKKGMFLNIRVYIGKDGKGLWTISKLVFQWES